MWEMLASRNTSFLEHKEIDTGHEICQHCCGYFFSLLNRKNEIILEDRACRDICHQYNAELRNSD